MDIFNRKEKSKQKKNVQIAVEKANLIDKLEQLKEKCKQLEKQALRLKEEYDTTTGSSKKTVGRQIEQIFRDIDRMQGQKSVILSKIDKYSLAQSKMEELTHAQPQGVDEDLLDDVAVDLQDAHEELKSTDRVAADLESIEYENPNMNKVDSEERLAEISESQESVNELPSEIEERLSQLETEED
jgi:sugar-specific transcriptional regulator TrmB